MVESLEQENTSNNVRIWVNKKEKEKRLVKLVQAC